MIPRPWRAALVALVLAVLGHVAAAHAQPVGAAGRATTSRSRVVVLCPSDADEVQRAVALRVRAEMLAAGFDAEVVASAPGAEPRDAVETSGISARAFTAIAVRFAAQGAAADVWIADHVTGKTLVRRIEIAASEAHDAAAVLALRAVELLRASLLEIAVPDATRARAPRRPPPADVVRWARAGVGPVPARPTALFEGGGVALAGALVASVASEASGLLLGPVAGLSLGARWGGFVRARGGTLFQLGGLRAPGGAATLRQDFALVQVGWAFAPARVHPVAFFVAAGLGACHTAVTATEVVAPNTGGSAEVWSLLVALTAGAALRLTPRVALLLELDAAGATPRPVVYIADQIVARPAVALGASLGALVTF